MDKKKAELKSLIACMLLVGCGNDQPVTWDIDAREQLFIRISNRIDEL